MEDLVNNCGLEKKKKKEKGKRKMKKRGRANVQSKHSQEGRVGWDGK